MRIFAWLAQIIATAGILIVPVLWPEQLALVKKYPYFASASNSHWTLNVPFFAFVGLAILLVIGQWADRYATSNEEKVVSDDRELMEAYANAVKDSIRSAHVAHHMNSAEKALAKRKIMLAIKNIVELYYGKTEMLDINVCCMAAYSTSNVPLDISARVRFMEGARLLASYPIVLDLDLWAVDCEPMKLAIPVEDMAKPAGQFKILPGAPYAFVMRKVHIVEVAEIDRHFKAPKGPGRNLDGVAREEQIKFLKDQSFESFVSIPLTQQDNTPIGVLNIQSNKEHILGHRGKHEKQVMNLLDPFCHALTLLMASATPITEVES